MFKCPHCGKGIPEKLVAEHTGRLGGKKTSERGPAYYRKIQAMRKTKAGGRPPVNKKTKT